MVYTDWKNSPLCKIGSWSSAEIIWWAECVFIHYPTLTPQNANGHFTLPSLYVCWKQTMTKKSSFFAAENSRAEKDIPLLNYRAICSKMKDLTIMLNLYYYKKTLFLQENMYLSACFLHPLAWQSKFRGVKMMSVKTEQSFKWVCTLMLLNTILMHLKNVLSPHVSILCAIWGTLSQFIRLCTLLEKSPPPTLNPGSFPSRISRSRIWVISNDKNSLGINILLITEI